MPYWEKLFKAWGIYNIDYHKKYREYLYSKRYLTYINLVANDIQDKIRDCNGKQIRELMDKKFPKPDFVCPDIPE